MIDKKVLQDWMSGMGVAAAECDRVEQIAVKTLPPGSPASGFW